MNIKEKKELNDFIIEHSSNIRQCAYLTNYTLVNLSCEKNLSHKGRETAMQIDVDHKYLSFNLCYGIEWAESSWKSKNYKEIIITLCHEIAHIVTTESEERLNIKSSNSEIEYYYERLTELTSRWLYNSYCTFIDRHKINLKTGKSK